MNNMYVVNCFWCNNVLAYRSGYGGEYYSCNNKICTRSSIIRISEESISLSIIVENYTLIYLYRDGETIYQLSNARNDFQPAIIMFYHFPFICPFLTDDLIIEKINAILLLR